MSAEQSTDEQLPKTESEARNAEDLPKERSLINPLPKPDPALKNYAEAAEEPEGGGAESGGKDEART